MNIMEKSDKVKSNTRITLSFMYSVTGTHVDQKTCSMAELVDHLLIIEAQHKNDLQLISGCRFGDLKTGKGSLRHDGNVLAISAIVVEHDSGTITLAEARATMAAARVGGLIYATPSHAPDAPRWRLICPLSSDLPREQHRGLVDRLNAVLNGALAQESWTVSQPYFFGFVSGKPKEWLAVEGGFLDQQVDFEAGGITSNEIQSLAAPVAKTAAELSAFDPEWLRRLIMQTGEHRMREPEWSSTLRALKGAFADRPDLGFDAASHVTAQWTDGVTSPEELAEKWDAQSPRSVGETEVIAYCRERGASPDAVGRYVAAAGLGRAQQAFTAEPRPIDSPTSPPASRKRFEISRITPLDHSIRQRELIAGWFGLGEFLRLNGSPGCGKTTLAVEGDFLDQRPDLDGEGTEAPSVTSTVNKSPEELKAFDPESLHRLVTQTGEHAMREPDWAAVLRALKGAFADRPDLGFDAAAHVTAQWTGGHTSADELQDKWDVQSPRSVGEPEVIAYCRELGASPDAVGRYVAAAGLARAQAAFDADPDTPPPTSTSTTRKRFAGIHARDFTVHVEPAIVDGLLTDGAAAAMIGPTSIGKTNLLIHLLCCIAHGIPFFGRDTERRAVALIEMEGARAVQSRILAWHGHYGLDISEAPFLLIPDSFNLAPDTDTPELIAALKGFEAEIKLPLGVVAIDTFHAASAGLNENDAGDVAVALRRLAQIRQETKAATLIVHHTGLSDATRGRGSSALKASLDTELLVEKTDGGLLMRATKQRDLDIGKPFHFRLQSYEVGYDRDGQSIFAPVVIPSAPPSRGSGREIKGHTADTLRVLKEECANGASVRREVWFAAFEDQYAGSADAAGRRRLFNKAVAALKERGLIMVDGGAVRPAGEMSSSAARLPGTSHWADLLDGTSPQ